MARPFLLACGLAFGLVSCSSTGYATKSDLTAPRTIRAPTHIPPGLVAYVPRFVESLEARGFAVGRTTDPNALELRFEHNDSVMNLSVSAGLWRQGVPILTASATNSGWGTALARGRALNSLADTALKQFDTELTELGSRIKVVPDASR